MKKKVWVIGGDEDDLFGVDQTVVLNPAENSRRAVTQNNRRVTTREGVVTQPAGPLKNPAKAFSLSLLIWGWGQYYIGKTRPAAIYLAAMVLFYATFTVLAVFRRSASRFMLENPIFLWITIIFLLVGLLIWVVNAVDAYYRTTKSRTMSYLGADRVIWPVFASLMLPGWGQFLNGQPKKGIFFLLFAILGCFSAIILATAGQVWPLLEMNPNRQIYEVCLLVAFTSIPLIMIMWSTSSYDAFRSCKDFSRHKQRSQMAGYRLQGRGLLTELTPQCSAVLGLLLAISLGMQFIPKGFYQQILNGARVEMLNSHMTIIPELIRKAMEVMEFLSG